MISRLVYVNCDECGDPAEAVLGRAKDARLAARVMGYQRRGNQDLCENCWRNADGWCYDRQQGKWKKDK
jgi:hypothetical protein